MIYVQLNDTVAVYEGMSNETIFKMLTDQNLTFSFVTEEFYKQKTAELEALWKAK
jgi:hypothetical protein